MFGTGRPPAYKSPEEFQEKIQEYFNSSPSRKVTDKDGVERKVPLITITGLALFLGFASRQSFYDYELKEEFAYTTKRARMFIEHEYEGQLQCGNTVAAIFALKNMGWYDRTQTELSGKDGGPLITTIERVIVKAAD